MKKILFITAVSIFFAIDLYTLQYGLYKVLGNETLSGFLISSFFAVATILVLVIVTRYLYSTASKRVTLRLFTIGVPFTLIISLMNFYALYEVSATSAMTNSYKVKLRENCENSGLYLNGEINRALKIKSAEYTLDSLKANFSIESFPKYSREYRMMISLKERIRFEDQKLRILYYEKEQIESKFDSICNYLLKELPPGNKTSKTEIEKLVSKFNLTISKIGLKHGIDFSELYIEIYKNVEFSDALRDLGKGLSREKNQTSDLQYNEGVAMTIYLLLSILMSIMPFFLVLVLRPENIDNPSFYKNKNAFDQNEINNIWGEATKIKGKDHE
ncbi:MAG: hypothetical protein AAFO82_16355 [Bacteroidota bacterium]